MMNYDIIIIGGGIIGTAIARELSRYRVNVALLEKEEELAFGVSKSNSGIIHPGTQNPPHSLKGKLCVQGNRLTRSIARELGVDFEEVGELIVAFTDDECVRLEQLKKEAEALGVPRLRIVTQPWLRKHEPNLNPQARAALHAPTAGIISPYRWVYDFAENAIANGAHFFTSTAVENITAIPKIEGGRKRFEVATPNGTFTARYIINAAGLYADAIARMLGISDFTIYPRKGEEFLFDKKRENIAHHLLFPLPTPTSKGILVIKTADGNPMIGPTAIDMVDKEDLATSNEGLMTVVAGAKKLVPSLNENDIIAYFAGLRPVGGNDFIIRHEKVVPGCITVAGIQSPGLTASPAIALLVVELLKQTGIKLSKKYFFKKYRQKTIHLFAIPLQKTRKLIQKDRAYGDIVCRCEMVSAKEVRDAILRGATTLDGIKFRTRAQAGRCHGSFCTSRLLRILAAETKKPLTHITKRGIGSEVIKELRYDAHT